MNKSNPLSFSLLIPWCKCSDKLINFRASYDISSYNAKKHPHLLKLKTLLSRLSFRPKIVIINSDSNGTYSGEWEDGWIGWKTFLDNGKASKLGRTPQGEIEWSRQSFGNFSNIIYFLKHDCLTVDRLAFVDFVQFRYNRYVLHFFNKWTSTSLEIIVLLSRPPEVSRFFELTSAWQLKYMRTKANRSSGWWYVAAIQKGTLDLRRLNTRGCVFLLYHHVSIALFFWCYLLNNTTIRGWMMWNFLVSGLSVGCTLVLYDGSPLRDPAFLWRLTDDLNITIYGTSAKYIDQLSVSISICGV